jgi:hypothetical protein
MRLRVNHQPFIIRLVDEPFEQRFPQASISPTAKAAIRIFPVAVIGRQITPERAGAQVLANGIDELAIVAGDAAPDAHPAPTDAAPKGSRCGPKGRDNDRHASMPAPPWIP